MGLGTARARRAHGRLVATTHSCAARERCALDAERRDGRYDSCRVLLVSSLLTSLVSRSVGRYTNSPHPVVVT